MKKVVAFLKKETVLCIAFLLAILSSFFVAPSKEYLSYIDFRSLGILWGLMLIMGGLKEIGFFSWMGEKLLARTSSTGSLVMCLVGLCFFSSMLITNDVALITFVPFAVFLLDACKKGELLIPVVTLQTLAANLGSMLTPVGNPQNLYLYNLSGMGLVQFLGLMLPYTAISLVLLLISIFLLKGRKDRLQIQMGGKSDKPDLRKLGLYLVLFVMALLTVARICPYQVMLGVVLVVIAIVDRKVIGSVDYSLLFTFVGFFIFTGNIGRIEQISNFLSQMVEGRSIASGVICSQFMSNVPAALLLSGFTTDISALTIGVNIGGLGTLIASMASLISYKELVAHHDELKGKYFAYFTLMNLAFLAVLAVAAAMMQ